MAGALFLLKCRHLHNSETGVAARTTLGNQEGGTASEDGGGRRPLRGDSRGRTQFMPFNFPSVSPLGTPRQQFVVAVVALAELPLISSAVSSSWSSASGR